MENFILAFTIIPLIGFLVSLLIPQKNETSISWCTFITIGAQLATTVIFIILWIIKGMPIYNFKEVTIYQTPQYEFFIDFYFDQTTAVFHFIGVFLTFLITIYNRRYMHREIGFKRFFNTILFFYLGYTITIISGNLETLFTGWEILGISSFLLIAFYKHRFLPVKNAVKVFSLYRIGDICIIAAMWLSHHLWHENITFIQLNDLTLVGEHIHDHYLLATIISSLLLLAAMIKSSLFPFSFWLPRAMEGPTPSSAIFYGSLSVHIGAFLLLRLYPFWESIIIVKIGIIIIGTITSIVANSIASVQSSVKSQIAYASISQIGLIFIEIALGFNFIALIHIAGNAFLRTYQLLISPSVVTYLIREQFYEYEPTIQKQLSSWKKKTYYSWYILGLKEWSLNERLNSIFWIPLKNIATSLEFISIKKAAILFSVLYISFCYALFNKEIIPEKVLNILPEIMALIGFILVVRTLIHKKNIITNWLLIIINHFWIALAISYNDDTTSKDLILYLGGVIISGFIGINVLSYLKSKEKDVSLKKFQGHSYEHPHLDFIFLLSCLGLAGFPITSTFIGEDLIFTHIHTNQLFLAIIISLSFLIDGISLVRMYATIFMGPHVKTYHEIARKSS